MAVTLELMANWLNMYTFVPGDFMFIYYLMMTTEKTPRQIQRYAFLLVRDEDEWVRDSRRQNVQEIAYRGREYSRIRGDSIVDLSPAGCGVGYGAQR